MSVAIEEIKDNKLYKIYNCEKNKIFTRYWNTNVKHSQKKIYYYLDFELLHVPADKVFLSKCYDQIGYKKNFKKEYFNLVNSLKNYSKKKISKILPQKIKNFLKEI